MNEEKKYGAVCEAEYYIFFGTLDDLLCAVIESGIDLNDLEFYDVGKQVKVKLTIDEQQSV
jgi:hypothetical protein